MAVTIPVTSDQLIVSVAVLIAAIFAVCPNIVATLPLVVVTSPQTMSSVLALIPVTSDQAIS